VTPDLPASLSSRHRRFEALRFYRRFVARDALCFDVGANIGNRSDLFLALGARVVAIEPQPECAQALRERFGDLIELVEAALGATCGDAELHVASYHTLSSLSPEWIEAVRGSGRFAEFSWDESLVVPMLTLDELIGRHGLPSFCKIDVEGHELEVLKGLHRALPALSFEYAFERIDSALASVGRLAQLGMHHFNYSEGETLRMALPHWIDEAEMVRYLTALPRTPDSFGDVYARQAARK
jgi:FkbM family methyltransferase